MKLPRGFRRAVWVRAQVCCPRRRGVLVTGVRARTFPPRDWACMLLGTSRSTPWSSNTLGPSFETKSQTEKRSFTSLRYVPQPPLRPRRPHALRGGALAAGPARRSVPDVLPIRRWRLRGCDCRAVSPLHRQHPHSLLPIPAVPVSADGALGGPRREWSGRPPAPPSPGSRRARDPGRNSACLFQNRGVYMFRMDSDHVIDATLTGGPAR